MEERLKQRLVGAVVLVSLAVVFVPILFDLPHGVNRETPATTISEIPERPQDQSGSSVSITLDLPQTQRLDAEVERERSVSDTGIDGGGASSGADAADSASTAPGAVVSAPEPAEPPASATRSDPSQTGSEPVSAAGKPPGDSEQKQAMQVPATDGWMVQLGSFQKSENALALRKRLQDRGYSAFVESGSSAQGAVSRVFVGPMPDRRQAKDSAAKLRREMALEGIVVPYPGG